MSDTDTAAPSLVAGAEAPAADPATTTAETAAAVTEATTEAVKATEGEAKTDGDNAPAKPIEYADFAMPEGVEVDADALGEFKGVAAEAGLSQDAAQKMIDLYAAKVTAPMQAWTAKQVAWQAEVKADPEYGPDLDAKLGQAKQFVTQIMGADAAKTMDALNYTGAGNNPQVIKLLVRASEMAREGQFVRGNAAEQRRATADVLYGSE